MLIKINGEEVEVADASTIQDVIAETNAPYTPGSIICLIKGKKELEKNISKYKIQNLLLMCGKINTRTLLIWISDGPLQQKWL